MGLSLDEVVRIFATIGIPLSRSSIWRDSKKKNIRTHMHSSARYITVLGINQSVKQRVMQREDLVVVVEFGDRRWVTLGIVDDCGPEAAGEWLQALVESFGLVIVGPLDLTPP
jgi:hypothetical protein